MSIQALFRLGALATLTTALLLAVGNLLYFAGARDTPAFVWISIIQAMLQVFVVTVVYAAQAQRSGVMTLLGYIILMIGLLFYLVNSEGRLAVAVGFLTPAQSTLPPQFVSLAILDPIATWATALGTVLFGLGAVRAGLFPRWVGLLLVMVGVTTVVEVSAVEYFWAILSVAAWAGIGWSLWAGQAAPADHLAAAV